MPPTQILNLRSFYVISETPCLDWREYSRKPTLSLFLESWRHSSRLGVANARLIQAKMGTSFKDEPQNLPSCAMLPTQVSESFTVELVD
jgi:hypothetical protein